MGVESAAPLAIHARLGSHTVPRVVGVYKLLTILNAMMRANKKWQQIDQPEHA
jgi:hypothetical protein